MAAAIAVLKKGGQHFSVSFEEGGVDLTSKVPVDRKRKIDVVVETLLNGKWLPRRMVLTRSILYFSMVGEDEVRDSIPLHEISRIEVMTSPDELERLTNPARIAADRRGSKECAANDIAARNNGPRQSLAFMHAFQIRTIPEGYNSGRTYYFQTHDAQSCSSFVEELQVLTDEAVARAEKATRFRKSQKFVASIYYSNLFQGLSAALIVANFATCIATAQLSVTNGHNGGHENFLKMLDRLDVFFVIAFTVELIINAYANWFTVFVQNAWSVFDIVIVTVSLVGLAPLGVPLGLLLLLRSCRVLRIFGKFKSVSQIFAALSWSILPMANVFFIIFVFASIYAIIAVTFFADDAPEELSTFARAFMSMFRITIGSVEWWFDAFPTVKPDYTLNWWPSFFLVTYVIIVTWVFFQVSIAVLLDNFLSASSAIKLEDTLAAIQMKQLSKQFKNPLDPLLLRLSKDYINEADLTLRLQELFKFLDSDGSGDLSSMEFQVAMKKLDFSPRIFVSDSDFIAITKDKSLCNSEGNLGQKEFEAVMREQLRLYTQSRLSSTSEYWTTSDQDFTPVASMKQILMEQQNLKNEQEATKKELFALVMETKDEVRQIMRFLQGGRHEGTSRALSLHSASMRTKTKASAQSSHIRPRNQPEAPCATTGLDALFGTVGSCQSSDNPHSHSSSSVGEGTLNGVNASSEEIIPKPWHKEGAENFGEKRSSSGLPASASLYHGHGDLCLLDSRHERHSESHPQDTLGSDYIRKAQIIPVSPRENFNGVGILTFPAVTGVDGQGTSVQNVPGPGAAPTSSIARKVLHRGARHTTANPSRPRQQGLRKDDGIESHVDADLDHKLQIRSASPTYGHYDEGISEGDRRAADMLQDHSHFPRKSRSPARLRATSGGSSSSHVPRKENALEITALQSIHAMSLPVVGPADKPGSAAPHWKDVRRRGGTRT